MVFKKFKQISEITKNWLPHRNNLRIPTTDAKKPSYKTPLDACFENIAWNNLLSNEFNGVKVKCKQNVHKIELDFASNVCSGGLTTQS